MQFRLTAAALAFSAVLTPAHAAPTPGEGLTQTVMAIAADPIGTVTNVVMNYPGVISNVPPLGIDLFLAGLAVVNGQPVDPNLRKVTVPLPGPAFLNEDIVNIPDTMRVNVAASGPLVVTVATGGR